MKIDPVHELLRVFDFLELEPYTVTNIEHRKTNSTRTQIVLPSMLRRIASSEKYIRYLRPHLSGAIKTGFVSGFEKPAVGADFKLDRLSREQLNRELSNVPRDVRLLLKQPTFEL